MSESMTNAHNDSQDTFMKLIQKSVHVCQVQGTMYNIHAQCHLPKAEPFHLQMGPHNIESMIYTYDDTDSRKIIHAYGLLMHAESNNKNIQCVFKADTAHSVMGPLMPRVKTRTYNAYSRQIQPTQSWVHSCRE